MTMEMLNKNKETKQRMVYSKELVEIEKNDTVKWVPTAKGHNVEILVGPTGYIIPEKSKINDPVSITFNIPGIYLYQCTPHVGLGMIGIVVVDKNISNKDAILKKKLIGNKAKKKRENLLKSISSP